MMLCALLGVTAAFRAGGRGVARGVRRFAEEDGGETIYPACTDEEVIEFFDKVPVFALADGEGNSAVVNDGEQRWLEFYCDPELAIRRKQQFDDQSGDGVVSALKVTATSLGRVAVAYQTGDDSIKARFVADPRELASARQVILRGAGAETAAKSNLTATELLEAYKLVDKDLRFATPSDVPLFSATPESRTQNDARFVRRHHEISGIEQLMLQRDDGPGMRPWFFSMADLIEQWRGACESDESFESGEVQILSLNEMLELMRLDCPTDHRARIFVPSKAALKAIGAA